jgi:hypothetical protein
MFLKIRYNKGQISILDIRKNLAGDYDSIGITEIMIIVIGQYRQRGKTVKQIFAINSIIYLTLHHFTVLNSCSVNIIHQEG